MPAQAMTSLQAQVRDVVVAGGAHHCRSMCMMAFLRRWRSPNVKYSMGARAPCGSRRSCAPKAARSGVGTLLSAVMMAHLGRPARPCRARVGVRDRVNLTL